MKDIITWCLVGLLATSCAPKIYVIECEQKKDPVSEIQYWQMPHIEGWPFISYPPYIEHDPLESLPEDFGLVEHGQMMQGNENISCLVDHGGEPCTWYSNNDLIELTTTKGDTIIKK